MITRINQATNKAIMLVFLGASLTTISALQAEEIKADSSIKAVTIYPSSAKVERLAVIKLGAGEHDVIINNLPINLNESSLRVSGEGQGNISLGSVELLRNFQENVVQQREKEIREKIEALNDTRREVKDAVQRSRKQFEYIQRMVLGSSTKAKNNKTNTSDGTYKNLPLEKWQEAWQLLDTSTAAVQEKIRTSEKTLKNIDKKIKKFNQELRQVAVNQRETRTAKLHVKSESATELSLKLTYQINGARWVPVYDADLNTSTGKVELKTLAQISQRTGEDWKDVDVTLSTLRPSAGTQLPTLNTWTLDFMQAFNPSYISKKKMYKREILREENMADSMDEAMPVPMVAMQAKGMSRTSLVVEQSQLLSTDFSADYHVPGLVSLSSGSNKRRFALTTQTMDATVNLASAPRQDPRAMILANIKHDGDTPLLAGNLSLYRNGNYVGNTSLEQKLSGEEFKLSFGADDKVKIKFLPNPDKKSNDGLLFGKRKVVERQYQYSIYSNHDKPFDITLYDVFPVAANEYIEVKLLGDKPNKKDVDDKKGVMSWTRTLKPKQDMKLKYGYTVSYPEDKRVPNL